MKQPNRQTFLKGLGLAGSTLLLPHARALGANEDIRVAMVGVRIRGGGLLREFRHVKGVRIAALCDVDSQVLGEQRQPFLDRGETVAAVADPRKLLDDKSIDAVVIATPNHWHALLTVWACQAGKDVYVEKPIAHHPWEGQQAVRAARGYWSCKPMPTRPRQLPRKVRCGRPSEKKGKKRGPVRFSLTGGTQPTTISPMARGPGQAPGGFVYHVLNRAVARLPLFAKPADYAAFLHGLAERIEGYPMRYLAFGLMPNHLRSRL